MGLISRVSSRTYRKTWTWKMSYLKPEQTYASLYSDAPKSEDKTASYGYQQQATQSAEAYYAQQEAISMLQQQQQEYEKQAAAAAYKSRRERSRTPERRRRSRSRSPH